MPASQLKRLKQSLRESGVTGPQKSKKQKKQIASSKDQTRRNDRAAALQNIRDSFNPFELKATNSRPAKFEHASASNGAGTGKYKAVLHRPGVSKSAGEEMRRATILPEMRRRNKVGGLVDRRIGEGDVDMTPEERAAARFAREQERKSKGRSMFDLEGSDDEGKGFQLTHGGKGVGDLAADDFGMSVSGESDDEGSDGGLFRKKRRRSDIEEEEVVADEEEEELEPEEPERKKTKKEVMEEIIAKSKMHKYERQKAKEDDEDLREELDKGFDEIFSLLKGAKKTAPPPKQPQLAAVTESGPVINADRQRLLDGMDREKADKEYDIRMKQLAMDARAKPSDKTLTAEEKAQKEAQRLKELEDKRRKRMRGEDVSDDETAPKDVGTQLEGDDEEIPDQAAEFGFTNSLPTRDVQPDEDEFEFDEDLIASDSEAELSDEQTEVESDADDEPAVDNEEDEFVKEVLGQDVSTGANTSALGERRSGTDASGLSYTYPCPRSHAELVDVVKDVPVDKLTTVIQRIRALYHPSLSSADKESMADFSAALVEHLAWMADNAQPLPVIEQVMRHLHSLSRTYPTEIGEAFRRRLAAFQERGQPTPGDLAQLTAISSIYPTSDHWHQVVTPAITLMARWLALNIPTASKPATVQTLKTGAFLVALGVKYQSLSKRYIPEAVRFTIRILDAGTGKQSAPKELLRSHIQNLTAMTDLWKEKSALIEIFSPALPILNRIDQNPQFKDLNAKTPHRNISILIQQSRAARRPLELHHHRPQPIRTSIPKFEENFNPDKHYDPDKERSEANKLKKEYKRERKGALRELRKDANFVAREQLKDKRERDAEYEKKYRRLIAEVQNEEGAASKDYERVKAKRTAEKKRNKK
ncbi:putative nucleolar complex protein 14 [Cercospora zeina]